MARMGRLVRIYPSVGGESGGYFEDPAEVVAAGPISRIEIRAGEYIDAIRVTYGRGSVARTGAWHGGGGGGVGSWDVPEGTEIGAVLGRHGNYVDQIRFIATGRDGSVVNSRSFGGPGGNSFSVDGGWIDANSVEYNTLVEIMGCCGEVVDRLYFRFKNEQLVSSVHTSRPWQPPGWITPPLDR